MIAADIHFICQLFGSQSFHQKYSVEHGVASGGLASYASFFLFLRPLTKKHTTNDRPHKKRGKFFQRHGATSSIKKDVGFNGWKTAEDHLTASNKTQKKLQKNAWKLTVLRPLA